MLLGDRNFPDAPERTISHSSLCGAPPDLAGRAHTLWRRSKALALFKRIAFEKQLAKYSQSTLCAGHPPPPVGRISFLSEKKHIRRLG